MRTYVVVYASRLINRELCPDARGRCDAAIKIARRTNATIVIGVGSPPGETHLDFSEAMVRYLVKKGWPRERMIVHPTGWSTLKESRAAYEAILKDGDGRIIVVSAWYHVLRVLFIWAVALGRFVWPWFSLKTYPWTNPFREVPAFFWNMWKIFVRKE